MRPHLFLTRDEIAGLRSLSQVRSALCEGRAAELWRKLQAKVAAESVQDAWTPKSPLAERPADAIAHADREYNLIALVTNRILDGAFAALITDDSSQAAAVLRQIGSLWDDDAWPDFEAFSHLRHGDHCSLRRGQLSLAIGLAYDWMHHLISPKQRRCMIDGYDRRFTEAFRVAHECGDRFTRMSNNFVPVIYGGFAIAAMAFGNDYERGDYLLQLCRPKMQVYAETLFGPEGEFPESMQYGASTADVVQYLTADYY